MLKIRNVEMESLNMNRGHLFKIKPKNDHCFKQYKVEHVIEQSDDEFINTARSIIESRISDSEYTAEMFVRDMNTSKTVLYNKFSRIVGQSPKEFIRNVRLQHATHLLKYNDMKIWEIANEVGFCDAAYFTRVFKKKIGESPTLYRRKHIDA
ncbi:helix-turn-helix domain-containing protein [Carboxylicivirga marina]|uniref:Helix-turn-helix transcriptional regulator n=1 Tax=Carboxylicivirga marina TaxID=2800988 RepID=A0ABS1HKT5_9BACT|nr:AraC family transcriptional regulator [Carboxylicivirga marina]MBK3518277.1 helix-turn-helix transcriptional regulator [Carboxylicivirga marina]